MDLMSRNQTATLFASVISCISLIIALLVVYTQLQVGKALAEAKLEILKESEQAYEQKSESNERYLRIKEELARLSKCCEGGKSDARDGHRSQ